MANEQWADRFVRLTLAARPAPGAGFEGRALAAMAAVRPRRRPNLVTIIVVTLILLVLAAGAYAAVRFFLEAKLGFSDTSLDSAPADFSTKILLGQTVGQDLEWETPDKPITWHQGTDEPSPDGTKRRAAIAGFA